MGTTTDQWPSKQGATMCVRHLWHSASAEVRLGHDACGIHSGTLGRRQARRKEKNGSIFRAGVFFLISFGYRTCAPSGCIVRTANQSKPTWPPLMFD